MQLGKNIKKRREEYDLTQSELAKRIGVSQAMIARFESDSKIPSLGVANSLANALNCSVDYLLGRTDKIA